jgi:short-subunit dehydrogenase
MTSRAKSDDQRMASRIASLAAGRLHSPAMFARLSGKRALVTGASRGLGVTIARTLGREGVSLVLVARDRTKLDAVARELSGPGKEVRTLVADVSVPGDRDRLAAEAGAIDILINNAAVSTTRALTDQSEAEIRAQVETNLIAPIELTRKLLPGMLERRRGVVVNVSSMASKGPVPYNTVYSATKHGLNGFSSSLRLELHDSGVHVGVVCPGFVSEAGMWADSGMAAPAVMAEVSPEAVARAVLKVIRGAREVLVTPGPVRPMLALRDLVPSIEGPLVRALGIAKVFAERAGRR